MLYAAREAKLLQNLGEIRIEGADIFSMLDIALTDGVEEIRISALKLLTISAKSTSLPSNEELKLLWNYYNTSLRCSSASLRQENLSCLGRLLIRMKTSVAAVLTRPQDYPRGIEEDIAYCEKWLRSMCDLCIMNLYPGCVYAKKYMALEILCMLLEVFRELLIPGEFKLAHSLKLNDRNSPIGTLLKSSASVGQGLKYGTFKPFSTALYEASTAKLLIASALDPWNKIRDSSCEALILLPSPLSSHRDFESVSLLMKHCFELLKSPRLSDSDAGAKLLAVVHQKYLIECQWKIRVSLSCRITVDNNTKLLSNQIDFFRDLVRLASSALDHATANLESAARKGFAHGYLIAIRYLLPYMSGYINHRFYNCKSVELDFNPMDEVGGILDKTYSLVMPVLSIPEENISTTEDNTNPGDMLDHKVKTEQLVLCASWINSKEICMIIDSLITLAATCDMDGRIFSHNVISRCGTLLLDILINAKHYGTLDKARDVLYRLAMQRCPSCTESQCRLRDSWLRRLFDHMKREGQDRRDAIRRSGGLPFGIESILNAFSYSKIPSDSMSSTLESLLKIALDDSCTKKVQWPRVHALNTLRLLYSDRQLECMNPYVEAGMSLALTFLLDGLSFKIWILCRCYADFTCPG